MNDQPFSHPSLSRRVRIEQNGREVRLVFAAESPAEADSLCEELLRQLRSGALNLTLMT